MGIRNAGKVSVTVEDNWDKTREYSKLSIVTTNNGSYISKKDVPKNIDISNTDYWMYFNFKASSTDFYNIPGDITTLINGYTEEAINKIEEVFGTKDGWALKNITQKCLIDINGIIITYKVSSIINGYNYYMTYYNGNFVTIQMTAEQNNTISPPTLDFKSVTITKQINDDVNLLYILPGNITTLTKDSTLEEIKAVLGSWDDLNTAIGNNKIITFKTSDDIYKGYILLSVEVDKTDASLIFYCNILNGYFKIIIKFDNGDYKNVGLVDLRLINSTKNGDIVVSTRETMSLEEYKFNNRSDAIGVVFNAKKGLFVRKNIYTGKLINNEYASDIFYSKIGCKFPYDGKSTQKLNIIHSTNIATDFPVFNYAENNNLYVASNGELEEIFKVLDYLDEIGSDYGSKANISSCTQSPLITNVSSVFYSACWGKSDIKDATTELNYFLIDIL